MKRLLICTLLCVSLLSGKERLETHHKSHKRLILTIIAVAATGVTIGVLESRRGNQQATYQTPDLKRITCAICSTKAQ